MEKYRVINGKINNKTLKEILYAYNNSKNLSTGFTPIELLNDKTKDDTVENHNILLERENKDEILPNGTSVRVLLTVSPFQKIKPVWSYEIYKVKSYSQSNYQLEGKDGYYKRDHLEVVNPKFLLNKEKVSPADLNTELENVDYADIPIVKDKKSVFKLEHAGNNDLNKSERINRGNIYKNVDIKDIKKSTKSKKKKKE